jgi:hypothetical protein
MIFIVTAFIIVLLAILASAVAATSIILALVSRRALPVRAVILALAALLFSLSLAPWLFLVLLVTSLSRLQWEVVLVATRRCSLISRTCWRFSDRGFHLQKVKRGQRHAHLFELRLHSTKLMYHLFTRKRGISSGLWWSGGC